MVDRNHLSCGMLSTRKMISEFLEYRKEMIQVFITKCAPKRPPDRPDRGISSNMLG